MPDRRTFLLSSLAVPVAARAADSKQPAPLRKRALGRTGLQVTELGFGAEAVADVTVFERALDHGINFFDTARPYQSGNAERALGAALGKRRKDVIVSSRSYVKKFEVMKGDLDASLQAVNTDYFDIWYMGQRDDPSEITPEMVEFQRAAQKAGKIRFRGISTHRLAKMVPTILEHKFDVVQIPWSFAVGTPMDPFKVDTTGINEAISTLHKAGVGIVAMKVMAGGYGMRDVQEPAAKIHARPGSRPAALRWVLNDKRISTTSVRMRDMDQLAENIEAAGRPFTPADRQILTAYLDRVSPVLCRMCGRCEGQCPAGVPAHDVVRSVMYAEAYGDYGFAQAAFERAGSASGCGDCSGCTVACPNGVNIPRAVARARQLFC